MSTTQLCASDVRRTFSAANIFLDAVQVNLFQLYHSELIRWNARAGLVSVGDEARILERHFLESALLTKSANLQPDARVLDLGTGGGFPGVPIKIVLSGICLALLDSKRKKTLFLRSLCDRLGLSGVDVFCVRAEELALRNECLQTFDVVLSRAVADLGSLWGLSVPFLKQGGALLTIRGSRAKAEIQALREQRGGVSVAVQPLSEWGCAASPGVCLVTVRHA